MSRALAGLVGLLIAVGAVGTAGCGSDSGRIDEPSRAPRTIRVPQDAPTIQAAVRTAVSGDLILVAPGTYREAVTVTVPGIVIRGLSRRRVVLDGGKTLENGFRVTADGVAIENLTVRRYTTNGILFEGSRRYGAAAGGPRRTLIGYRASYVTAIDNGLYGLYAFSARQGLFDEVYASGSPDSGIYIGQCKPCDAVVRHALAEFNAVGYEGTNAGGNLFVVDSVWRRNGVGMTSNSEDTEDLAPQRAAVFAGNLVTDNDELAAPRGTGFGVGIVIGGGTVDQVVRNRVIGHRNGGILVTDLGPYTPSGNEVRGNVLAGNGADLVYGWQGAATEAAGNCFTGNTFTSSSPADIEAVLPCGSAATAPLGRIEVPATPPAGPVVLPDPPADLPDLPRAATAPARPAIDAPPRIDLARITVPAAP